ncbi:MAG: hypothetical protein JWN45_1813, partial [Acidobacteriaceae bacterium]|nr:hypothetical protein [Acidobacteriaceae bacterium]
LKAAMLELLDMSLMPAQREEDVPESKLSPGYFLRVEYLVYLEGMMKAGAKFDLFADEVEGLRALQSARAEFEREHPACSGCGTNQYSAFATRCHACGAQFKRSA